MPRVGIDDAAGFGRHRYAPAGGAPQPEEQLLEARVRREGRGAFGSTRCERPTCRSSPSPRSTAPDSSRGFVDDPVNRQLGRIVAYQWGDRGLLEQPGLPLRLGPAPRPAAPAHIPTLGEHTHELLEPLGFDADMRAAFAASGTIPR